MPLKKKKNKLVFLLLLSISTTFSCHINSFQNKLNVKSENNTISVSKTKGANLSIKINTENSAFKVKANSNGTLAKTRADIKSYLVYLLKTNSATFPSGGDPLNTSNIAYGPITVNKSILTGDTLTFSGVDSSTTSFGSGDYYHVAIRAFDGTNASGNEIIKDNNSGTAWTGTTTSTPKTAVSTGNGIQVLESDLSVSSTTSLPISLNLEDGVGAKSNLEVTLNGDTSRVKSYALNLSTDPNTPITSKTLGTNISINADNTQFVSANTHRFNYSDLQAGTYYATAIAFEDTNASGKNVTKKNNSGATYSAPDADARVAVSSNTVTIANDLTYSFSSGSFFDIDLNIIQGFLITTVAGTGTASFGGDSGQATAAQLNTPGDTVVDSNGNIYIADNQNHRIRKIDTSGVITTIAGTGTPGSTGDSGPAASATLNSPSGLAIDSSDDLYIAESFGQRIRKIDFPAGTISTVIGTGDGVGFPFGIDIDSSDNLYVANFFPNNILKYDGATTTIVAGGGASTADNIDATNASFNSASVRDISVDSAGNIYIAEGGQHRIRKVDTSATPQITTVAGVLNSACATYSPPGTTCGDGGQATVAQLNTPNGIETDGTNLFISVSNNHIIRKVDSAGVITTIAGTGTAGTGPADIPPIVGTTGQLNGPGSLFLDSSGSIYIADSSNNKIRKLVED